MLVLRAGIYIQIANDLGTQAILGEHTLYHLAEEVFGAFVHQVTRCELTLSARIARVAEINTTVPLITGENDLVCVDNDHVIATINMRGEVGLVFAAQELCHFGTHTAKCLSFSIYNDPFLRNSCFVRRNGLEA